MRANRALKFGRNSGFTFIPVRISNIRSNPFRRLKKYPLLESKIAKLVSSIRRNEFWGNVVARKSVGQSYELAFGHHRVEAAKRVFWNEAEIQILVGDLSDAQMIQFMAADNDETYQPAPSFILEVVEAAIRFLGKDLSPSPVKAIGGSGTATPRGEDELASKVAKFLGWPWRRVAAALAALRSIRAGQLSEEAAKIIPSQKALVYFRQVLDQAAQFGTPVAHSVQVEIAKKVAKHANPSLAARVLISEQTHPIQLGGRRDALQEDIDLACRHGAAFDVALTKIVEQKQAFDSCQGLGKIYLATLCAHLSSSIARLNE